MNNPGSPQPAVQALAESNAREVVAMLSSGGQALALARQRQQLEQFRLANQPHLSDKQYTALYRTYTDYFVYASKKLLDPSADLSPVMPTASSAVADGDEVYRPNAAPLSADQWAAHVKEVQALAVRFAHEVAVLASTGGDTTSRMAEQQLEAASFSLDRGLNDSERAKIAPIYKQAFLSALEEAAGAAEHAALGRSNAPRTSSSGDLGELAVRTAVRATVWNAVNSIFRLFR